MHRSLISLAVALALAGGAAAPVIAAPKPSTAPAAESTTQLPRGVRPLHYDIALTPDADTGREARRRAASRSTRRN